MDGLGSFHRRTAGGVRSKVDLPEIFQRLTERSNCVSQLIVAADDSLQATAEPDRTRPRVGRQIVTRLMTTTTGASTLGIPGAIGGFVLGPVVEEALNAGQTTKLQTAKWMTELATAIRRGEVARVMRLTQRLQRAGVSAGQMTGRPSTTLVPAAPATARQ